MTQTSASQTASTGLDVERLPDGVVTLWLNRPTKGNALDPGLRDAITHWADTLARDDTCRVLVLRGRGRHFCSGSDVDSVGRQSALQRMASYIALERLPKPTVAVTHGACMGAGLALAACCDIILAATNTQFSVPEVRIGMTPGALAPLLIRALGERAYLRLALMGSRFSADQAHRLGFVHDVYDSADLDAALVNVLNELLHGAPHAMATLKRDAQRLSHHPDMAAQLTRLAQSEGDTLAKQEVREGLASLRERRPPAWAGRASRS